MKRRGWHVREEEFLVKHYADMTIKEIQQGLKAMSKREKPVTRSADSINAKIKRLKSEGKLEGHKEKEAVGRSLVQRRKELGDEII